MEVTDLNHYPASVDATPWISTEGQIMHAGKLGFSQVMDHLPMHTFNRCIFRYQGERYVKWFGCYYQYLVMAFVQPTHRESLRDIEACLLAHQNKMYRMGIRSSRSSNMARNTLSKANERRD